MEQSLEERLQQSIKLMKMLKQLGVDLKIEGMKQFSKLLNEFVKENKIASGKIFLKEENLFLHYKLTNKKGKDCEAILSSSGKRRF